MNAETKYAEAMRLAARRLETHAERTKRQANALEEPSGFGERYDADRRRVAATLRREAAEDTCRVEELDILRAQV